ncbi:2OG-Fe(II) oxygenase [Bosea sp. (in: a-proteobacteria)]|uniref:2OG-Fe(II) oxygenase family protein n=1 Tax=Bosea sp. (in: a-proteobacteria) TaxID=1871050 RepID=UPI001AD1CF67|nr:2OG-Fe(II) oxygenase [Bosea sp. (in: a-proteobacteria)]MBN9442701.1 2OG-Fe(II) oxygenase [Bosea sp. (in: a-proteobacteria)]
MPTAYSCIDIDSVRNARTEREPYNYLVASHVILPDAVGGLRRDFPDIRETGFFPEEDVERHGAFASLLEEMKGREISEIVSGKLDIDLVDKPKMITIRKLSAAKDGRIHTDSEAKIATLLVYLNDAWQDSPAGRLRVLRNGTDFEAMAEEISPVTGSLFAFRRADNSWHGHTSFVGERRVVQMTWLRSQADVDRKKSRGSLSHFFKKVLRFG